MAITKKEIIIKPDAEGNINIEAFGYADGECKKATKEIEEAIGNVTSRKMKPHEVEVEVTKKVRAT